MWTKIKKGSTFVMNKTKETAHSIAGVVSDIYGSLKTGDGKIIAGIISAGLGIGLGGSLIVSGIFQNKLAKA